MTKAIQAGVSPETLDFIIAAICTVTGETRDEVVRRNNSLFSI